MLERNLGECVSVKCGRKHRRRSVQIAAGDASVLSPGGEQAAAARDGELAALDEEVVVTVDPGDIAEEEKETLFPGDTRVFRYCSCCK